MIPTALPKAVRQAINRNAHRLALEKAYQAFHDELEELVVNLIEQSDTSVYAIVERLDHARLDCITRSSLEEA
ncbi:MAG: hypothetical protein KDH93_21315 [Rhodoferax sp.]|nr:hypothetical protein [Rhodoferax sp.]MCP5263651.1 hypothetical protein [Rhodoferax sp.]